VHPGQIPLKVLHSGLRGRAEFVGAGRDSHLVEVRQVIAAAPRGIIGQERVADSELPEQSEKRKRVFEQSAAAVNRAIHVQGDMADLAQTLVQRCARL
jgi:hypothetical protein